MTQEEKREAILKMRNLYQNSPKKREPEEKKLVVDQDITMRKFEMALRNKNKNA